MLDKKDLAKELKVSIPTIDRLIAKGMPKIKVGKAVRFEYPEVVAWLKSRQNAKGE